ncbi:hypothetical protein Nepgr_018548 [Nepenthes gracilis]|uniref:Uncharacterized protein n=1 Tax=Nepenthes gracilis TaxID=150966 RepID=A0AAD3XT65_NEPGR|nr:hypothetical protein Nepgr_018548 [Nepenthes gracilis]
MEERMQEIGRSSRGSASAPSPSASHPLEEGANARDKLPTVLAGVSRGPKHEGSIELVFVPTSTQHGVPIITSALSDELAPSHFAT